MPAGLHIALSYFSFVPLQRWLNWVFGGLLCFGLLRQLASEIAYDRTGWMVFSSVCALIVAAAPVFAGGGAMRIASTPSTMHLRPHGRRLMLVGAGLAITLVAALMTLPLMVFQLGDAPLLIRGAEITLPALPVFLILWGSTMVAWTVVFAMSRHQTLGTLSFVLLIAMGYVVAQLVSHLSITVNQLAVGINAIGIIAWTAFGHWYTKTDSIQQVSNAFAQWGMRPAATSVSRPTALFQYFIGSGTYRNMVMLGGFVALMILVLPVFFSALVAPRSPYQSTGLGIIMGIMALAWTPQIVRRSRLLWLRAGMDRATLFAAAEHHARLSALSTLSIPLVLFLSLSLVQRPDLAVSILLFTGLQLVFAICLLYSGFTATRARNVGSAVASIGLILIFVVVSRSMEPDKELSAWAYLIALAIFGTLAAGLRWTAKREWLALDWRVARPPQMSLRI